MPSYIVKAVVLEDVGKLEIREIPIPKCPSDGILIRVNACAICGTDLKVYRYGHRLIRPPRITGHELAGTIVGIGAEVKGYKEGDRVTVAPAVPCGECYYCRRGIQDVCEDLKAIGYHYDGGFAEYMVIPSRAIKNDCVNILPDSVSFDNATLTEPIASVINCHEITDVKLGDTVVIIGNGPLGYLHGQVSKLRGASKVIMVGRSPDRLKNSNESGVDIYINRTVEDPIRRILGETGERGAEAIILACSSGEAQEEALEMVSARGRINFFSSLRKDKPTINLDSNQVHYKECYITGSHGSTPRQNKLSLELISGSKIIVKDIITHYLPISKIKDGFDIIENRKGFKVILKSGLE